MVKKGTSVLLVAGIFLMASSIDCFGDGTKKILDGKSSLETLYKNVVDELVNIGKAHPGSQSKVYGVLDQIDQINVTAKHALGQEVELKEIIKKKEAEITALQQDLLLMKNEHDGLQQKYNSITKKLEAEKKQTKLFAEEKKKLEKQVGTLQAMNVPPSSEEMVTDKIDKHEKSDEK